MPQLPRRSALNRIGTAAAIAVSGLPQILYASSETGKIRIGQIGTSHAHASKLSAYRKSSDYEVVGIVEPNDALRQKAMQQEAFRDLEWMTIEELFNQPGLQAVLVETEVCDLLANAQKCVQAGMHVHIDKPAGESLPDLQKVLTLADERKLMVQMGYMYRYNPGVQLLRQFLNEGGLGEIFEVHTVMSKVVDAESRKELARYPGGTMFELGCHLIDLVVGILGRPMSVTPYARQSAPAKDSLVDNMLAVLEYPAATATVRSTALEVEGSSRRHLVVCGTKGTFQIQPLDAPAVTLSLSQSVGDWKSGKQTISLPRYVRYVDDAADMAKVIRGEKPNDFDSTHDLAVQETVLKACGLPIT
jgi:predicted dehydrogenase